MSLIYFSVYNAYQYLMQVVVNLIRDLKMLYLLVI